MAVRIVKPRPSVAKGDLGACEKAMGNRLPEDYRAFLLQHDGGIPEANEFDVHGQGNSSGVDEFLAVREALSKKRILADRFVAEALPIAYAEGGNYVCLVFGEQPGIYYWDHELEPAEGTAPTRDNMFLLARTFAEFLENLREFDPSAVELKPDQVKRAWIDPDFLRSQKK